MKSNESTKTVVTIALLVAALVFYFVLLGQRGIALIQDGGVAAVGLGVGVLILPFLGAWIVYATLRAGLQHQKLARRIGDEGLELDVTNLPKRPSGRIDRDAADALFQQVKAEWEADPDNWRSSYRLARAYDYAGDRGRARETMKRAVELERLERESGAGQ
ncbi:MULTISPECIES: hypothetical protein [Rhodococcus]|uniref:Cytochrome c biogenesis factor n=1 Tax=Rhodococcus oxybenzonivorans TaxID=1990687 RepID=A0AAE4UW14_9NOCA|nr:MULTISPECIES: hypothetical protein [Rhodococcus]MDV7244898.1 hypothetical protein [Rhodococcus oxybenzonivorans]MDV7263697.1 hypothetical protein [Rhodococcus oxybenzonivorans]MDV7275603.1 hypothetical protein [Rhodococcus oxybenzonivorans]MDV7332380.1 hypothetical protein [Rhodococcus oxybenzonivorans]MDV7346176.1 hypothetical protein [Rhodococcus oxybenzonivorans]